jgi:acylphosphatase
LVRGRVQGVGYRASAAAEAERLGLAGWVRNRRDGKVETLAEGEGAAVAQYAAWCARGPRGSQVTGVEELERRAVSAADPALGEFAIHPTA